MKIRLGSRLGFDEGLGSSRVMARTVHHKPKIKQGQCDGRLGKHAMDESK